MTYNARVRFVALAVGALSLPAVIISELNTFSYGLFTAAAVFEFLLLVILTTPTLPGAIWVGRVRRLAILGLMILTGVTAWYLILTVPATIR